MRTETSSFAMREKPESPPSKSVWSTERRMMEKPAPGAPRKMRSFHADSESDRKKQRVDRLLLPSKTIDEDEDDYHEVDLAFRPSRLFQTEEETAFTPVSDPTTVLMVPVPETHYPCVFDDVEDMTLSPRLLRFNPSTSALARYESVEIAEDHSSDIFRRSEFDIEEDQQRFTNSPTVRRKDDSEERV